MGMIYEKLLDAKTQADSVETVNLDDIRGNASHASWHQLTPVSVDGTATGTVAVGYIPNLCTVPEVLKDIYGAPVIFDLENPQTSIIDKLFMDSLVFTPADVVGSYRVAVSGGN